MKIARRFIQRGSPRAWGLLGMMWIAVGLASVLVAYPTVGYVQIGGGTAYLLAAAVRVKLGPAPPRAGQEYEPWRPRLFRGIALRLEETALWPRRTPRS